MSRRQRRTVEMSGIRSGTGYIGAGIRRVISRGVRCMPCGDNTPVVTTRGDRPGARIRGNTRICVTESLVRFHPEIIQVREISALQCLRGRPCLCQLHGLSQRTAGCIHCLALPHVQVNDIRQVRVRVVLGDIFRMECGAGEIMQPAQVSIHPDGLEAEHRGSLRGASQCLQVSSPDARRCRGFRRWTSIRDLLHVGGIRSAARGLGSAAALLCVRVHFLAVRGITLGIIVAIGIRLVQPWRHLLALGSLLWLGRLVSGLVGSFRILRILDDLRSGFLRRILGHCVLLDNLRSFESTFHICSLSGVIRVTVSQWVGYA